MRGIVAGRGDGIDQLNFFITFLPALLFIACASKEEGFISHGHSAEDNGRDECLKLRVYDGAGKAERVDLACDARTNNSSGERVVAVDDGSMDSTVDVVPSDGVGESEVEAPAEQPAPVSPAEDDSDVEMPEVVRPENYVMTEFVVLEEEFLLFKPSTTWGKRIEPTLRASIVKYKSLDATRDVEMKSINCRGKAMCRARLEFGSLKVAIALFDDVKNGAMFGWEGTTMVFDPAEKGKELVRGNAKIQIVHLLAPGYSLRMDMLGVYHTSELERIFAP